MADKSFLHPSFRGMARETEFTEMKIALVIDDTRRDRTPLERSFYWRGLIPLLAEHQLTVLCASETAHLSTLADEYDTIFTVGTALFDQDKVRWSLDEVRQLGSSLVPLGLSLPPTLLEADWNGEVPGLLNVLAQRGAISVADSATLELLCKKIHKKAAVLTGLPAIFAESAPLIRHEARYLFFGADESLDLADGKSRARVVRKVHSHFAQRHKTLFCALRPEDLALGAEPGLNTLYQPLFPALFGRAIASASAVVSCRLLPALAALAHRVPAVYVGKDEWSQNVAAAYDLPVVELHAESDPLDIHHRVEERLKKFPWERVNSGLETLRRATSQYLMERGIPVTQEDAGRQKKFFSVGSAPEPLHVCSVADGRYFPFVAGLIENLLAVHGKDLSFHFLALDKRAEARAQEFSRICNINIYSLGDIWDRTELPRILGRSNGFRAFSSKPRFLHHVLGRVSAPVVYADADMYFFQSPQTLHDEFADKKALLFPHWNDDPVAARHDGLFNAGLIAVKPGAETFLDWWGTLCLQRCEFDWRDGIVGDQGYLDFAPVHFSEVGVYRRGDQNVARWNLHTLGANRPKEGRDVPSLHRGCPVASFHAAFGDDLGLFEIKIGWDQLVHFFSDASSKHEMDQLFKQVIDQQRNHWLLLARLINVHGWLAEVFSLTQEHPSRGTLRFFVRGMGRYFLNGILTLARRSRERRIPLQAEFGGELTFWQRLQRSRLETQGAAPQTGSANTLVEPRTAAHA